MVSTLGLAVLAVQRFRIAASGIVRVSHILSLIGIHAAILLRFSRARFGNPAAIGKAGLAGLQFKLFFADNAGFDG